jgi:Domain of unknown function (DUF4398)
MKTANRNLIGALALAGLSSACATTNVPAQLGVARDTYTDLSSGPVAKLTPVELDDARQALEKANQELAAHGDTNVCRDYAYIAQNKLELADAMAQTEIDRRTIVEALKAGAADQQARGEESSMSGSSVSSEP